MYLLTHTRLRSCQLILFTASSALTLTQDKTTQINFLQIREWRVSDAHGSAAFWLSIYVLLALFYHKEITFHYPVLNNITPQKRFRAQTVNTVQHRSVCLITSLLVDQIHKASISGQLAWTCRQPTWGKKKQRIKCVWAVFPGNIILQTDTNTPFERPSPVMSSNRCTRTPPLPPPSSSVTEPQVFPASPQLDRFVEWFKGEEFCN